jgi:hypothetical protein
MKGELGQQAREICSQQLGIDDPPQNPADMLSKYGAAATAAFNDCVANTLLPMQKGDPPPLPTAR